MGDSRQTEVALDKGRTVAGHAALPRKPGTTISSWTPGQFDFYAMDCYRTIGADTMAEHLAEEVIEANTDFDGRERAPMRMAEARITLGVVRAREGDLEGAVSQGMRALEGERKSVPSLLMASRDLTKVLNDRYAGEARTKDYLDHLTR